MNALQLIGQRPYKVERPGQYLLQCPCHEDDLPSLAIKQLPDGRILTHCFAGCNWQDVQTALGADPKVRGPFSPSEGHPPPSAPSLPPLDLSVLRPLNGAWYEYLQKERGISPAVADRFHLGRAKGRLALPVWEDGKVSDIRLWLCPARRVSKADPKIKSWARGRGGSRWYPLWEPPSQDVLLVGGELDALCAISMGYPAVTTTGSESSFPAKLAKSLKDMGVRTAHVLLDNDKTGKAGSELRKKRLTEVGIHTCVISFPEGTEDKWDVTDEWVKYGSLGRCI